MTQPEDQPDSEPPSVALEPDWSTARDVPVSVANVFVAQLAGVSRSGRPDGIYLVSGHAAPPLLLGSPESIRKALAALDGRLPVDVVSQVFLTRDRVQELVELLQDTIKKFDEASGVKK